MEDRTPASAASSLGLFEARRALSKWERIAIVVAALVLLNVWVEVLALAGAGNAWGHLSFKLQWVGTYQLALIAGYGSLAWLFVLWRHVLARSTVIRRVLRLPPLRGVVVLEPTPSPQGDLFEKNRGEP